MLHAETVGFVNVQSSIETLFNKSKKILHMGTGLSTQLNSLAEYISRIASAPKKWSLIQAAIRLGNEALCNLVLKYFIAFMFYLSAELSYL